MATYRVWSGASGANNGTSWTDAYTSFASAVSAATASGDIILVHYTSQLNLAADTTFTFLNNVSVISVDKDASDAPTAMGTGGWIGHSTTTYGITLAGAYRVYLYGITLRLASSSTRTINLAATDGADQTIENCYLWVGTTASGGSVILGAGSSSSNGSVWSKNSTWRFGAASQGITLGARLLVEGGSISSAGSAPSTLFNSFYPNAAPVWFRGVDLSFLGSGTLVGSAGSGAVTFNFDRCLLGTSYVALATQTPANLSAAEVYILDCSTGSAQGLYGYHNAQGSVVSDTGIKLTASAAGQSWKVTTTANASFYTPFVTPWISFYHSGTSAITPRIEILRDGSTTAYNNDEVWSEWLVKVTASSPLATLYSDRRGLTSSAAAQDTGAGTGSWTGASGTAWSGKCDSGASVTPASVGDLSGRLCVGAANATVYASPEPLVA